jgi:hypothetical protein
MKKISLIALAMIAMISVSTAQKTAVVLSDKAGWHKVGETTVDFKAKMQEVNVLGSNKFSALKFTVTDSPIEIQDIDLYFDEGDKQTLTVGSPIKNAGESSKEIPMQGGAERNLRKIVFRYKTLPNRNDAKAHVEIWGLKTNADKTGDSKNSNWDNGNNKK